MLRKRKQGTPAFKLPAPFNPVTGGHAELIKSGVFPYVAMMQVAAPDTEQDYVLCRGFDVRIGRFIDYEDGNADKPGIPVAKPYSKRTVGAYTVGQIFPAVLPLQTDNPSPADVLWRVGQNPGVAKTTAGHPADLDEEVEALKDADDVYINWMLLDSAGGGAGAEIISFRVLSAGPFAYSDLPECESAIRVLAEVVEVNCGSCSVSVGDRVIIYDPRHCKFDIPIEVLLGALGTATKMQNTMTSDFGEVLEYCAEYEELSGLTCRWVVIDLTCCEEIYGCD